MMSPVRVRLCQFKHDYLGVERFFCLAEMHSNEIDKFGILDLLILSSAGDPGEKMETINNAVQCIIIEKPKAESLWSAYNRRLLCRNNPLT